MVITIGNCVDRHSHHESDHRDAASSASERSSRSSSRGDESNDADDDRDGYMSASPVPSPVQLKPQLPPYFPALQGCRNVEEFQCLNRIEEGTYGVVYRAVDRKTGTLRDTVSNAYVERYNSLHVDGR